MEFKKANSVLHSDSYVMSEQEFLFVREIIKDFKANRMELYKPAEREVRV